MFQFFANIFGYLLQLLYNIVNNYGLAIILFTVIIKLLQIPLSIKQQRTMIKSSKLQQKMQVIQFKYKNNPEKMNQEIMDLYKNEKLNPFSGCFMSIVQMILILSIFYLVKSPLTFMEKVPQESLNTYIGQVKEAGHEISQVYPEIDLIREYEFLKEKNPEDINVDRLNIEMNFLGLDLSKIPQQNLTDYTVYIIPILYILSSFVSIKMTTSMQEKMQRNEDNLIDGETGKELQPKEEIDPMLQTNKMMSWMMPIMSISIAMVAPLGLALYWLISNILMILERLFLNKFIKA